MPRSSPSNLGPRLRALAPASIALTLLMPSLTGCEPPQSGNEAQGDGNSAAADPTTSAVEVATIHKIRGSRGLKAPDLPEGAFLGEGASLKAGQWIELPGGTRVELSLTSGQRLRLDENTRLRLPDSLDVVEGKNPTMTLERGRLIVLADPPSPDASVPVLEVIAADDRLVIERGEVELHAGETRHYGVVQGHARLFTADREIPLGPGASISTPAAPDVRPETPPDPTILAAALTPQLSLEPLHESAWASAFEESAKLADDLPQGVGSLVARRAGSQVERQSLRLTEQTVKVSISGRIARTEIEQAFHNDASQVLEGIYQFPLPSDASISDLQLLVGQTWMRGEMLEKQRARQIFREIVDATVPRDPALLQWEEGSVFKLNIFPIPAKGERRIKIAYTQVLPTVGEALRYRYPMGGSGATATEIGDFRFEVEVDGRELDEQTLAGVSTPMAELAREREGSLLRMTMKERDFQPTHELGVDVPLAKDERRVSAATHRDKAGQGYFMLTLRPDLRLQADPRPVHYAFVLDRSHGTTPELWTAAEGLTKAMIDTLEPQDRFTLLACDTACDRLDGGLRSVDARTIPSLDGFFDRQVLAGASDLGNMLRRASAALNEDGSAANEVERVIVYLGDGVPTSGALTPDELGTIAGGLAQVRIQSVALGSRSDLLVLDHLARKSGGDVLQADARDDLERLARELRLRAQVPVARDLALELPPGLVDVHPKQLPSLRPGDTITLVGKLAEGQASSLRGDIRLRGRGPSGEVDEAFQIMLDAEYSTDDVGVHAHLPRTWAHQQIAFLTQTQGASAKDQIVSLSRDFNVLSRWTALLVLENDAMYREFGVARKAEDTTTWTGNLPTTTPTAPSGGAPLPDPSDRAASPVEEAEATSEAAKDKGGAEQAPTPKPAKSDFDDFSGGDGSFDNQFAPAPADEKKRSESSFDDFEGEPAFDEGSIGGGGGSQSGSGGFAPAPDSGTKTKKSSKPVNGISDPWNDWGGGWDGGRQGKWRPPVMEIRAVTGASDKQRQVIAALKIKRDADPSERKTHRELVRKAVRAGDRDALAFAAAWAAADPDHAPALLAHADLLAAAGDPLALRAYDSAVEVEPFSKKLHQRQAEALRLAGDFERACSHREALVSIDPADTQAAVDLIECLTEAGRAADAREVLTAARGRLSGKAAKALTKAESQIVQGVERRPSSLHSFADLRAELRWSAAENLDIAFVDEKARRLSVMRPELVRVREQLDGGERVETMTLREISGDVLIEVTRPQSTSEDPVRAVLEIQTATGARERFNLQLEPGTRRIALVRWQDLGRSNHWR